MTKAVGVCIGFSWRCWRCRAIDIRMLRADWSRDYFSYALRSVTNALFKLWCESKWATCLTSCCSWTVLHRRTSDSHKQLVTEANDLYNVYGSDLMLSRTHGSETWSSHETVSSILPCSCLLIFVGKLIYNEWYTERARHDLNSYFEVLLYL